MIIIDLLATASNSNVQHKMFIAKYLKDLDK